MLQLPNFSDFRNPFHRDFCISDIWMSTVLNLASGGVARLLDYLIRMFWMWWQMEPWHRARERGDGYSLAPRLATNTSTRYKIFLKVLTIMLICSYVRGHTRRGGRKHSWDVMVSTTSRPVFFLRRLSRCRASAAGAAVRQSGCDFNYKWRRLHLTPVTCKMGCFCPSIVKCKTVLPEPEYQYFD